MVRSASAAAVVAVGEHVSHCDVASAWCPCAQIEFQKAASTFNSLFVVADNGILFKVNVITDDDGACGSTRSGCVGGMYLDGDRENSSSADG